MAVKDWSTTAASNTSVGGKSIAENMAPGDVNDAMRAIMAEAKARFNEAISIRDFGAVGDGVADDTAAINAFHAYIVANKAKGVVPGGTYNFTAALTAVAGDDIDVRGEGNATYRYTGAGTTPGNLVTIGDGITAWRRIRWRGVKIDSSTALAGGYAMRVRSCVGFDIDALIGDEYGSYNLYHGLSLEGVTDARLNNSGFYTPQTCVTWSNGFELHCQNATVKGKVVAGHGTGIGFLIGGNCGGFYAEQCTQLQNDIGCKIDTSITGTGNQQFFFETGTFDTNNTAGILVNDTSVNPGGKSIKLSNWLANSTGASGAGLVVTAWTGGKIAIGDVMMTAHIGSAITVADATVLIEIAAGAAIYRNGRYGIEASTPITVQCNADLNKLNTLGPFSSNVTIQNIKQGKQRIDQDPTTQWGGDFTQNTVTVANGANAALAVGSGLIIVSNPNNGLSAAYLVGGGVAVMLGTTGGSWVAPTTTPGAGTSSVQYDGVSAYKLYNNFGSSQAFVVALPVKTRASV